MTPRIHVYAAIDSERDYQDARKAEDNGKATHSVEEFLLYMGDYLHEARHVAARTWGGEAMPKMLEVLRKVVALGVACMEQHGAPQRAGFERMSNRINWGPGQGQPVLATNYKDWSLYARVSLAISLLETLPPNAAGLDYDSWRGREGQGYHKPLLPETLAGLKKYKDMLLRHGLQDDWAARRAEDSVGL